MSEQLDIGRVIQLLRVDLIARHRILLVASGAVTAAFVLIAILMPHLFQTPQVVFSGLLVIAILVSGPIAASHSFNELHSRSKNEAYLLVPASALEKMLCRLLQAAFLFPLSVLVFVVLLSVVVAVIRLPIVGGEFALFSPWPMLDLRLIGFVIVNQSIFFLGAAWFRKQQFFKTILTCTGLSIAGLFFVSLIIRVFFGDVWSVGIDPDVDWRAMFQGWAGSMSAFGSLAKVLYFFGLPVFCWTVSWMRIRETQVSHGL
jgi:hypothetical protein